MLMRQPQLWAIERALRATVEWTVKLTHQAQLRVVLTSYSIDTGRNSYSEFLLCGTYIGSYP